MSFWNHYPYTDFHELNLDWIINILREMEKKLENFVATNSIKYANPFQWSIVNQYEKNTLVIEPNTGTAYLSVQAVPQGVNISNTDYWTPVFDLSTLFVDINKNFTGHDEQLNVYSSANYSVGDWLLWKNKLYKVITAITAGEALADGTNIEQITIESVIDGINTAIDSINAELVIIRNAKTSFNSVSEMIADIDADNATHATTSGYYSANDGGGANYIIRDIEGSDVISVSVDGTTSAQGLVRLNNTKCAELVSDVVNVLQYGAKADGVTPCNVLIDSIITYNRANGIKKNVYFPAGDYYFSVYLMSIRQEVPATLPILDLGNIEIYGDGRNTIIKAYYADVFQLNGVSNIKIHDLSITATVPTSPSHGCNGVSMTHGTHDVEIYRVHCFDLPYYLGSGYIDGSKAFTCQQDKSISADIYNVSVHDCTCVNCAIGFESSFWIESDSYICNDIIVTNNDFDCIGIGITLGGAATSESVYRTSKFIVSDNVIKAPLGLQFIRVKGITASSNVITTKAIASGFSAAVPRVSGIEMTECLFSNLIDNVIYSDGCAEFITFGSTSLGPCYGCVIDGNQMIGGVMTAGYSMNTRGTLGDEGGSYPNYCTLANNRSVNQAGVIRDIKLFNPTFKDAAVTNYIYGQFNP